MLVFFELNDRVQSKMWRARMFSCRVRLGAWGGRDPCGETARDLGQPGLAEHGGHADESDARVAALVHSAVARALHRQPAHSFADQPDQPRNSSLSDTRTMK